MKNAVLALVTVALVFSATDSALAQDRADGEWWGWALAQVVEDGRDSFDAARGPWDRDIGDVDFEDRRRRSDRARRRGPPFCRNGQGHPVHGVEWCREKGFGRYARWDRAGWEDIIFDRRPRTRYPSGGTLGRGPLIDILGDIVFGRLQRHARRNGVGERITGRWYRPRGGSAEVLQLRAGGVPLAELTDVDGDGRVDAVLLHRMR